MPDKWEYPWYAAWDLAFHCVRWRWWTRRSRKSSRFLRSAPRAKTSRRSTPTASSTNITRGGRVDAENRGIHACRPLDLSYWPDEELWVIELGEPILERPTQLVAGRGRLIERVHAWNETTRRAFAETCVVRAKDAVARALAEGGADREGASLATASTMESISVAVKALAGAFPIVSYVTAPIEPHSPLRGISSAPHIAPANVGNGFDYAAMVSSGSMTFAQGSFPVVTNVTSESNNGGLVNGYSLQINSNPFGDPTACSGSPNPASCQGWQQFMYNSASYIFMQAWLLNYGPTCPGNWISDGAGSCLQNSGTVSLPAQPVTNLGNLVLSATTGSGVDTVRMTTGNGQLFAVSQASLVNLQNWTAAEFNVVGNCCLAQAVFNNNATMVVATSISNGTTASPSCVVTGFTGETNNLNLLSSSCCPVGGASPGISFTQSNASGAIPPFCLLNDILPVLTPLL